MTLLTSCSANGGKIREWKSASELRIEKEGIREKERQERGKK